MYAVVYTTEGRDENEQVYEDISNPNSFHVYYCKHKELAIKYVINRFVKIYNYLRKNPRYRITKVSSNQILKPDHDTGILISACGDACKYASWNNAYIEYEYSDKAEYPYFIHRFKIIRMQEIVIGKNGPTLHVE